MTATVPTKNIYIYTENLPELQATKHRMAANKICVFILCFDLVFCPLEPHLNVTCPNHTQGQLCAKSTNPYVLKIKIENYLEMRWMPKQTLTTHNSDTNTIKL